ncbi:response regulator transcription factor [Actinospica durhamensis]|uniref:Response regulator transcription factor n=1 Tax=Actinospica durhamensis TaxID=1508375 RepID=A0A941EIR9_9ACTN|nr:response regulator transcription factor [Actinospica durhamensis]MBR7831996.1 response regulator transcription factor [Actinospica durhamensis]
MTETRQGPAVPAQRGDEPIRVLLVDDHALLRRGLDIVLQTEPDIVVVGEAGDGSEAVAKAAELLPDLVLLDVKMPSRDGIGGGIQAAAAIKEVAPSTRIVMLTMSEEEEDLYEAIKAGASGYLLKGILPHEIADSIRAVVGGQSLISPPMAAKLLTEFATMVRHGEDRKNPGPPAPRLTDRELEVLKLIATGANNSKIAKTLFISENTVKNHVRNILEKLQLHSRMEAVMYAVREKILDLP